MKIELNDPSAAASLIAALERSDCLVARTGHNTVDVFFPWLKDDHDTAQARMELAFFLKAWARRMPGLQTTLAD